jgi:hypothetical protein
MLKNTKKTIEKILRIVLLLLILAVEVFAIIEMLISEIIL